MSGGVIDLFYAIKTPEGVIRNLMTTTTGFHALQVNEHNADRAFGTKMFDNGTKSGKAMCFAEIVAKLQDDRSDVSEEDPRLSDECRDEVNDMPFEEDT